MTRDDALRPLLDDAQAERYSRQIILPDVGARGQARLCAAKAAVIGDGPGASAARAYLRAAGVEVLDPPYPTQVDCVVVTDAGIVRERGHLPPSAPDAPVSWFALLGTTLTSGRTTAGRALAAFASVEHRPTTDAAIATALERMGGAQAAACAVAALLGWGGATETEAIEF